MPPPPAMFLFAVSLLILLYVAYWINLMYRSDDVPRSRNRTACRRYRSPPPKRWTEYFDGPGDGQTQQPTNQGGEIDLQDAINFSDILVTDESKKESKQAEQEKGQIQTIDDRFKAARRNVVEFKMKKGVYTNKQRRQLVETLLRRPPCGRRVRSWRTENSDFLRGDVRPKPSSGSTNLVRSAKSNPEIDLHPGALGPMAGLQGLWLSEENLPGNVFQDAELVG